MNAILESLEQTDHEIIRLWNTCHSAETIADTLGIDEEYIKEVIDQQGNYE